MLETKVKRALNFSEELRLADNDKDQGKREQTSAVNVGQIPNSGLRERGYQL